MAESLGTIYYDVDANLEPLLGKMRQAESALGGLGKEMGKADQSAGRLDAKMTKTAVAVDKATRSASGAQSAFGGLYKVLAAYIGLQTFETLISLSDEYGQMASRVRQVTKDTAEYEMVQARLLKTANATYRPLSEAQEVFIRTADSIRDLGYTTEQALDITDSFSFLLVTNAASADRAKSAIDAYSKSIQTGKVSSDQWQSILAAMPTIVDGISSATGRSREEIKKLGVEGRLSLEALNEGLRRSRDENEALAEEMETSAQDAFTALRNSLQVFVGKVNESSGATGILTSAVGDLSEVLQDPNTIRAAQELAAGVVTALNKIISAAREVVSVTRWMAEEMAARMGGAAADDIVRLNDEAQRLRKTLNGDWSIMELAQGPLVPGKRILDGLFNRDELKKRLAEVEQMIADWKPPTPAPAPAPSGSGGETERPEYIEAQAKATEKKTTARKRLTEAEKEAAKAARDLDAAQQRDAEVLAQLKEAIYQTTLSTEELVQRKAELMLSEYATPEQIEKVKELARQLEIAQKEAAEMEQRRSVFAGDAAAAIRGQVTPLSGGAFDDQVARYEAEAAAEQERYAAQLERLREAKELEIEVIGGYQALEEQMAQEHAARMAQIDQARMQMMIKSGEEGFGALSDIMKTAFGEQSAAYKVAFAAQKAFAIAQSLVAIQQGIALAAANPWPTNLAAMASVAAATSGLVANISSVSMSGGRLAGGPVSAGKMYRVNENGAPEVFSAANGQQFLIPNQRGEVISNRDATAGGGGVVINIHNAPQGTVAESSKGQDGQQIIDIWVADFMSDGRTASAVQGKFGLSPQGR